MPGARTASHLRKQAILFMISEPYAGNQLHLPVTGHCRESTHLHSASSFSNVSDWTAAYIEAASLPQHSRVASLASKSTPPQTVPASAYTVQQDVVERMCSCKYCI